LKKKAKPTSHLVMNSKIKFYKQREGTAVCVPLAILNIFKLTGSKANKSGKLYKIIKKRVDYIPGKGTYPQDIGPVLRSFGFKVKVRRNVSTRWVVDELKKGRVVIYTGQAHSSLIINHTPKYFIVVNASDAFTVSYRSKKHYLKAGEFNHAVSVSLEKYKEKKITF